MLKCFYTMTEKEKHMNLTDYIPLPYLIIAALILFMNVLGFLMMGIDKYKARHERWRIRERTLMLVALLGGAVGVWLGMRIFRHKTLYRLFSWGVPAIFFAEAALLLWLLLR